MRAFVGAGFTRLVGLLVGLTGVVVAHADGGLPPQPYRYLHPPPALAAGNSPPGSGTLMVGVSRGHSLSGFAFTTDNQAGVAMHDNAFRLPAAATSLEVRIRPIETPPGLPAQLVQDGNAYSFTPVGRPGSAAATQVRKVDITLRWPRIPLGIYQYTGGRWRQLCDSTTAVFSPATITCSSRSLGIFMVVTVPTPGNNGTSSPSTGSSGSRLSGAVPWIIGVAVLLLAALVALFLVRAAARSRGRRNGS